VDVLHTLANGEVSIDRRPTIIHQEEINSISSTIDNRADEGNDEDKNDDDEEEEEEFMSNEIPRQQPRGYHASSSPVDFVKKSYKSNILEVSKCTSTFVFSLNISSASSGEGL